MALEVAILVTFSPSTFTHTDVLPLVPLRSMTIAFSAFIVTFYLTYKPPYMAGSDNSGT